MALGQTAGCPRVNRAKKFMCSPRNTGNISFSLWLIGGLSQGRPDFQKVYVPFSCPIKGSFFWPGVVFAKLGGRFAYFLFFPTRGGGRASPRRREGRGIGFLLKIPGRGGFLQDKRGRGAGRLSAANWGIFWRGG